MRRKSVIDRIAAVSDLLDACDRDDLACAPEVMTAGLRRQTIILWATRLVRTDAAWWSRTRSTPSSPSSTASSSSVAPDQLADWRRRLDAPELKPFIRIGAWVGGDRDGNPNVDAEALRAAFATAGPGGAALLSGGGERPGRRAQPVGLAGRRSVPELTALADGVGRPVARTAPTSPIAAR